MPFEVTLPVGREFPTFDVADIGRAFLITLYRPLITEVPGDIHNVHRDIWQDQIRHKIDSAASQTNAIFDYLARENLLNHSAPMT